ncbi:MAG: 23S rRNA (uracil(1939)-C(5))-methyltransferase RlmD [Chitinophagales bacterium]
MRPPKPVKILPHLEITAMASNGCGIARNEGKVVFVKQAVPGDQADVRLTLDKKSFAEGEIAALHQSSSQRVTPPCAHFGTCGGCTWQQLDYQAQLQYKTQIVEDALIRIGKLEIAEVRPIIGCDKAYGYRNKMEYSFTNRAWLTQEEIDSGENFDRRGLGFHVPGNFMGVLNVEQCFLQEDLGNRIRNGVRHFALKNNYSFFNQKTQEGLLRNLMLRTATTGEVMVLLSVTAPEMEAISALMEFCKTTFPEITSLQYVVNGKKNSTIYDLQPQVYHGNSFIYEQLGSYRFKIQPKSFFQTNSRQAQVLYDVVKDFAALQPDDHVYDLYTGVGSIGIYLSDACRQVVGIEQVADAIVDAKENAALNQVSNCSFHTGDVRLLLNDEFLAAHGKPSVVVTDPPRAGMHADVVRTLLAATPPRLVYVSCNPATQARDIDLLSEKYRVSKIQPVDMFPQTTHIENVALLELK